jgi:subtilisin family serine protease
MRAARWPVAAPGGEAETVASDCATGGTPKGILSTYWVRGRHDEYACLAGTSMSTPHVAGALAVLLSQGRAPQAAVDRLIGTARDLGPAGRDDQFGMGLIDLARAVSDAPANSTTSTSASTTTGPSVTATTATTVPSVTTTVPPVSIPTPVQAAPFTTTGPPARDPADEDAVPGWLVAIAIAAVVASGGATATAAWNLAERERT